MHSPPKINAGRVTTLSQNTAKPEPQCVQSYPITSLLPTIVSTKFIPQNKKSWPWHNLLPEFPSRSDIDSRAYIKLDKDPSNNHQDPNDPNNDPNSRYKHNEDMMRNGNHNGRIIIKGSSRTGLSLKFKASPLKFAGRNGPARPDLSSLRFTTLLNLSE